MRSRRLAALVTTLLAVGALLPPPALAHGLTGRADLPIPKWLFAWGAAAVLVVSFVALAIGWRRPRFADYPVWPLPRAVSRALLSRALAAACGAIGVLLLGLTIWAGFFGDQTPVFNIAPTFVYVAFWVGLVPVSVLFGNVLSVFNPWLAIGRAVSFLGSRLLGERLGQGLAYPERLGQWPAAAGLFAFTWLELLAPNGAVPRTLATATLVYTAVTFLGMGLFGVETWARRGESFGVYFGLFASLSPVGRDEDDVVLRPPLAGLTEPRALSGTVAVLSVMIGTVTFDGMQETAFWSDLGPHISGFFQNVGAGPTLADELAGGVGLAGTVAAVGLFFLLGNLGARLAVGMYETVGLAQAFVYSLVPIALVYVGAHYLTFLLFQGQALVPLASDPAGKGWDLFGTVHSSVNYGLISATVTWYIQVAFVVTGHACGLTLAHDRALELYEKPRDAVRSQYWMLAVMVSFTCLALWLLSQANA
jgi:hypothetical protein